MPLHVRTPTIASLPLSAAAGRAIDLKLEALQPTGSFKLRGIGAACEAYAARGARRFVSSSGGNAGVAVAHAGRRLGVPVVVVVPETTTGHARRLIAGEGATLRVDGASWHEAHAVAVALCRDDDALLHPFDDPLIWSGHATMIDEAAADGPRPDAVVVAVGGGGLLCGVVEGLERNGWAAVPVIAVETARTASLARSIASGRRVVLDDVGGVATSLAAKQVCERAFALATRRPVVPVVVSDVAAVSACVRFLDDHRLVVEPACGAALAVAYDALPILAPYLRVLVVVCGGATATVTQLLQWSVALSGTG